VSFIDRRRRGRTSTAIEEFWAWWADPGRVMIETALARQEMVDAAPELTRRVRALGPGLEWHLGPGTAVAHSFTLSAANAPEQRPTAERWRRLAPDSGNWEFRSAKAADPAPLAHRLALPGASIDLAEATLTFDDSGRRVDVVVIHPAFARVARESAQQVAFFVLDWLLGEDALERWIGPIDIAIEPAGVPPARLAEAVAERDLARDLDSWGVLQGELNGMPLLAVVRSHLDRFDHPTYDRHHAVTARFLANAGGLPDDLDALQSGEEIFSGIPGAVLVATETHTGTRTLHLYSDSDDSTATAAVGAAARAAGRKVITRHDPAWAAVRHLRSR